MVKDQEVDLTVMDSDTWSETDQRISKIKDIFKEEGVDNDPDLMTAFDEAVKHAVKGEIVDEEIK